MDDESLSPSKPMVTARMAILDSLASATVTGVAGLESRNPSFEREMVTSERAFRFGHGNPVRGIGKGVIYAEIKIDTEKHLPDQILCSIDVEVIPRDIPFLLSRASRSRMGALIDFPQTR